MRTVHKFTLAHGGDNAILLESTAKPVHFAVQNGTPCLWIELDPSREPIGLSYFRIYGTGHAMPAHDRYHAHFMTCQDGPYVWHLYRVSPPA